VRCCNDYNSFYSCAFPNGFNNLGLRAVITIGQKRCVTVMLVKLCVRVNIQNITNTSGQTVIVIIICAEIDSYSYANVNRTCNYYQGKLTKFEVSTLLFISLKFIHWF